MSRLEIDYDIPENAYPKIISEILKHLTIKSEDHMSFITEKNWQEAREVLAEKIAFGKIPSFDVSWDYSGYYAKHFGIFPINLNEARKALAKRYGVPITPGCTTQYRIDIFGKKVMGIGDHAMTIRMDGDFRGHADNLYHLKEWQELAKKTNRDEINDKIIDSGIRIKDDYPKHSAMLANLPRESKAFEEKIESAKVELTLILIHWSINMIRFFWDFLGKPINNAGHFPQSITVKGAYGFELLISKKDLNVITQYPTLEITEVAKKIFPKALDDFSLVV